MNSNLCRIACGLILCLTPVLAQTSPEPGKVRFRTCGWRVAPDDLYYDLDGRDTKVSIVESGRSAFNDTPRDAKQIVFYRLVAGPAQAKPVREVAATVNIAAAGPWPLVIFMANPEEPKHYRVAAIADDLKTFPFPSCRFVNLTTVDLYARYGDQKVKVAVKGVERLDPNLKSTTEPETRYTTVSIITPQGPKMLYSNNWAVRPTQRTLVFVFAQDDRLQLMRLGDDLALYTPRTKH